MDLGNFNLEGILGGLNNITATEDIPTIINEFAKILVQIIEIIKKFLGLGGEPTDPEATTNA